jgi:hypothetical protein
MDWLVIDKDGLAVNHIVANEGFDPGEGLHLEPVGNQPWRPVEPPPVTSQRTGVPPS